MGGSGALKERFLADEDFHNLDEEAYADLYQDLVASGTATELLESAVSRAGAAGDTGARAAGEQLAERIAAVARKPGEVGSLSVLRARRSAPPCPNPKTARSLTRTGSWSGEVTRPRGSRESR